MTEQSGDLGAYLRARRARVAPADLGLPAPGQRRTPGLRREEVAAFAGVSIDYYVRLEQGRDRHPSAQVVEALARVLQLGVDERVHLYLLAGQPAPSRPRAAQQVRPTTLALLRGLDPIPAYITSRAMDVLAWNPAMATLLLDFAALPAAERNMVRLTFLHPPMRQLWTDWDAAADESVANVRAATARFPDDPALISLVGELTIASPDFASRWARHDVKNKVSGRKRLSHPVAGPLNLAYEVLTLEADGHRLFTYLPADAATAEALATLLGPPSGRRTPAPTGLRVVG